MDIHPIAAEVASALTDPRHPEAKGLSLLAGLLVSATAVLALGTTILMGASALYFQQSARLLVPIVVLALILDLLYLPTILKRFDRGGFLRCDPRGSR